MNNRFGFFSDLSNTVDNAEKRQHLKETVLESVVDDLDDNGFNKLCGLVESEFE